MDDQAQIEQFVTINREGKNVPTSLYLDLLKHLPKQKSPSELAAERAADIATEMRRDRNSIFYGRIVVTTSPGRGQISIVNFVRKVTPYVNPEKGLLNNCTLAQQTTILENYFSGIRKTFGDEWKSDDSIFFKTVGFGALMNVFDDVFKECTVQGEGFRVSDVTEVLDLVKSFDFAQWSAMGSGNKAEMDAAKEFQVDFARAVAKRRSVTGTAKQLRL